MDIKVFNKATVLNYRIGQLRSIIEHFDKAKEAMNKVDKVTICVQYAYGDIDAEVDKESFDFIIEAIDSHVSRNYSKELEQLEKEFDEL